LSSFSYEIIRDKSEQAIEITSSNFDSLIGKEPHLTLFCKDSDICAKAYTLWHEIAPLVPQQASIAHCGTDPALCSRFNLKVHPGIFIFYPNGTFVRFQGLWSKKSVLDFANDPSRSELKGQLPPPLSPLKEAFIVILPYLRQVDEAIEHFSGHVGLKE